MGEGLNANRGREREEKREGGKEEGERHGGKKERRETGKDEERNAEEGREGRGKDMREEEEKKEKGRGSRGRGGQVSGPHSSLWPPVHLESGRKEPKIREKQGSGSLPPRVTLEYVVGVHVCVRLDVPVMCV